MRGNCIILVIIGAAISLLCASCRQSEPAQSLNAIKVEAMAVEPMLLTGLRHYPGIIEESEGIDLSFTVAGLMDSLWVGEGDFVRQGQPIGQLNSNALRGNLKAAKETLGNVERLYDRSKEQYDRGALSEAKWSEMRAALLTAKSNEALAAKALEDATLYAPFSGFVAKRYAKEGNVVAPTVPVIKLAKIDDAHIVISLPEDEISNLAIGDTAEISVKGLKGRRFWGDVVERGVAASPSTGAYPVKIRVENTDYSIRPGMDCDVRINSGVAAMGIVLAPQLVHRDTHNRDYVWIAYNGKAVKRDVQLGGRTDGGIIISAGVSAGDSVIISDQHKVNEYSPVLIANR